MRILDGLQGWNRYECRMHEGRQRRNCCRERCKKPGRVYPFLFMSMDGTVVGQCRSNCRQVEARQCAWPLPAKRNNAAINEKGRAINRHFQASRVWTSRYKIEHKKRLFFHLTSLFNLVMVLKIIHTKLITC